MRRAFLAATALLAISACAQSNSEPAKTDYTLTPMVEGLDTPWGGAFLPDGDMLVTERSGQLRLIDDWTLVSEPIANVPIVFDNNQGGLLDVILDPDFESNRTLYLSYAKGSRAANGTAIAKARLSDDRTRLTDVTDIFVVGFQKRGGGHFGGQMAFLDDGSLLLTLGEGFAYKEESQSLSNHLGTIVRINTDGTAPQDNPFIGQDGALPEIYSYGHRNVQGLAIDPDTGAIWAHEHGPKGGDEVNLIAPGKNYGWPVITYGVNYDGTIISEETHQDGMEQPVVKWVPSIAPSAMIYYSGDKHSELTGDLIVSALAGAQIRRLDLENGEIIDQEKLIDGGRYRFVIQGPGGEIYVSTDDSDGGIYRLDEAG